jgi:phosphate transport system substrate-binding protein
MISLRPWVFLAYLAALLLFVPSLALPEDNKSIRIDGSSTVFLITEAVVEEFHKATKGKIKVTVGISGSGGGFRKFTRGETDISDASRPILAVEMEEAKKNGIT